MLFYYTLEYLILIGQSELYMTYTFVKHTIYKNINIIRNIIITLHFIVATHHLNKMYLNVIIYSTFYN